MRIGILTFHNVINYGGTLQCLALQTFLKKNGYNAKIINYQSKNIEKANALIKKNNFKSLIKSIITFLPNSIRYIRYEKFIKQNLILTNKIYNYDELKKEIEDNFDIIIVGSDQVWNDEIINTEKNIYFLKDINIEKISYAASTGNDSETSLKNIFDNSNFFYKISVREESTMIKLKEKYGLTTEVSIDPTFLLKKSDWEKYCDNNAKPEKKILLLYILNDDILIKPLVYKVKEEYKIDTVKTFSKKKFGIKGIKSIATSGPREFLNDFNKSDVIITNSFHGTAFSIIFNKNFYVILPKKRQERILNLLEKFGLKERIISSISEIERIKKSSINYSKVNAKKEYFVKKSREYFKECLKK